MADENEEMTYAEAESIADRLDKEYRFIGKIKDVLHTYNRAKFALTDLDRKRQELEGQLAKAQQELDNFMVHHETTMKERQAEAQKQVADLEREHRDRKARIAAEIAELEKQKLASHAEANRASEQAVFAVKDAEARIKETEEATKREIEEIKQRSKNVEAEYKMLSRRLDALKKGVVALPT